VKGQADNKRRTEKIAPGSTLRIGDKERLYRDQMGAAALSRQKLAAERERKHRGRLLKRVA